MLAGATPMGFIAVSGFATARAFYETILGLSFESQDEFALVLRSGPIVVRFSVPPSRQSARHTVFGWRVADIGSVVAALTAAGVTMELYAWFGDSQGADGVWNAPNGDRIAWFKDPDGNLLSVSQHVG